MPKILRQKNLLAFKRQFFKPPKSHPGQKMNMPLKKHSMEELPRIKTVPIAIQFLGTYFIVMGVSNLPGNIEMEYSKQKQESSDRQNNHRC